MLSHAQGSASSLDPSEIALVPSPEVATIHPKLVRCVAFYQTPLEHYFQKVLKAEPLGLVQLLQRIGRLQLDEAPQIQLCIASLEAQISSLLPSTVNAEPTPEDYANSNKYFLLSILYRKFGNDSQKAAAEAYAQKAKALGCYYLPYRATSLTGTFGNIGFYDLWHQQDPYNHFRYIIPAAKRGHPEAMQLLSRHLSGHSDYEIFRIYYEEYLDEEQRDELWHQAKAQNQIEGEEDNYPRHRQIKVTYYQKQVCFQHLHDAMDAGNLDAATLIAKDFCVDQPPVFYEALLRFLAQGPNVFANEALAKLLQDRHDPAYLDFATRAAELGSKHYIIALANNYLSEDPTNPSLLAKALYLIKHLSKDSDKGVKIGCLVEVTETAWQLGNRALFVEGCAALTEFGYYYLRYPSAFFNDGAIPKLVENFLSNFNTHPHNPTLIYHAYRALFDFQSTLSFNADKITAKDPDFDIPIDKVAKLSEFAAEFRAMAKRALASKNPQHPFIACCAEDLDVEVLMERLGEELSYPIGMARLKFLELKKQTLMQKKTLTQQMLPTAVAGKILSYDLKPRDERRLAAFKKIHAALLAGQTGPVFTHLPKLDKDDPYLSCEKVKMHALKGMRTQRAWELAANYGDFLNDARTYQRLLQKIYVDSVGCSGLGLFKHAKINGQSFFKRESLYRYLVQHPEALDADSLEKFPHDERVTRIQAVLGKTLKL